MKQLAGGVSGCGNEVDKAQPSALSDELGLGLLWLRVQLHWCDCVDYPHSGDWMMGEGGEFRRLSLNAIHELLNFVVEEDLFSWTSRFCYLLERVYCP